MATEHPVPMPQMGESIAEGTVVKWHKKVGDRVKRDETLFEISTDKVDTEVPSPRDGLLVRILVQEGETVPVHSVVCLLAEGAGQPTEAQARPPAPGAGVTAARTGSPPNAGRPVSAETAERGPERSSPLVRRLAAEHGIDLAQVRGSGHEGRVTKEDLLAHVAERRGGTSTSAPESSAASLPVEDRVEPLSVMRQKIAEHMVASRRTSAHVSSIFEVDLTPVRKLRERLATPAQGEGAPRVTYLTCVLHAVSRALRAHPRLNASLEGSQVRYHGEINLGVAVALEEGLIVPVIPRADQLDLDGLARTVSDLASRARSKKLRPEEVQGGTFTVTNPGVFGSLIGTPIIHQPQVAILCLGAVKKRPVVLEESDAIAVRSMAFLSLSFDHRWIDGSVADRFMADVKGRLESGTF